MIQGERKYFYHGLRSTVGTVFFSYDKFVVAVEKKSHFHMIQG